MNKLLSALFLSIIAISPVNALLTPREQYYVAVRICDGYKRGWTDKEIVEFTLDYIWQNDPQIQLFSQLNEYGDADFMINEQVNTNVTFIQQYLNQLDDNCQLR